MEYQELMKMSNDDIFQRMLADGEITDAKEKSVLDHYLYLNPKRNYQVLKRCCTRIGYSLEPETTYLQLNDNRILIVNATAGSGKTISMSIKIIRRIALKGTNPKKICVLSFNKASVRDIKQKIESISTQFNIETSRFGIRLGVTDLPNIRSLNSLTYNIVEQFKDRFGLAKVNIVSDGVAEEIMNNVAKDISKKYNGAFLPTAELVSNMCSLFDLLNETLSDIDEYEKSSLIISSGINVAVAKEILISYRARLNIRELLSHSDTCRLIIELAEKDEKFKKELQSYYELIVVDEVQDISEATFRLLKLLVGDRNDLWAVGDGDQSIYRFKGSRPNNCQLLMKDFPDAIACNLSLNRRVPQNILDMSNLALKAMTDRNSIMPRALKSGGLVENKTYTSKKEVIENLALKFKNMPKVELGNNAIGYRKNFSAFYIVNILQDVGIPFQIKDDFKPGSDIFSIAMRDVMALLKAPGNLNYITNAIYKICSAPKNPPIELINEVLHKRYKQYDLVNRDIIRDYFETIMEEEDAEYFYEIPTKYFGAKDEEKLSFEFKKLEDISEDVRSKESLISLIPRVYEILGPSYWNFIRKVKNFPDELEAMILEDWSRDMSYNEYKIMKAEQENRIAEDTKKGYGVKLYTMHSLKGLEFDNMYIVELENSTMPLIREDLKYTEKEVEEIVNEELRLLYVAMTRAKQELHLYWSEENQSPFYEMVDEYNAMHGSNQEDEINLKLDLVSDEPIQITDESMLRLDLDINLTDNDTSQDDSNLDLQVPLDLDLNIPHNTDDDFNIDIDLGSVSNEESNNDLNLDINLLSNDEQEEEVNNDLNLELSEVTIGDDSKLNPDVKDLDVTVNTSTKTNIMNKITKAEEQKVVPELKQDLTQEQVSELENRLFSSEEGNFPEYYSGDTSADINSVISDFHTDEDFVELKEGKALQGILNIICKEISI